MTELALRAYISADAYRLKGVKVVMGGIHPTVLPNRGLKHADAVVVGEAEGIWPRLCIGCLIGTVDRIYRWRYK